MCSFKNSNGINPRRVDIKEVHMLAVKTILTTPVTKNYKVRKPANVVRVAINYHMVSGGWYLIGQTPIHYAVTEVS